MARSLRTRVQGVALAAVVASLLAVPTSASARGCQIPAGQPRAGAGNAVANGVTVVSPCLAWFVGSISNGPSSAPLIERWTGTAWKTQPAPNPSNASLAGVVATSATNAWAVGRTLSASKIHPLIERWNGTGWKVQHLPNAGANGAFTGVAATSDTDAWAVGTANENTLVEHWTGTAWKVVPSPSPGTARGLEAVDAISPSNAWAVGFTQPQSGPLSSLILHWNGRAWLVQRPPDLGTNVSAELHGITATSHSDAWAVGLQYNGVVQSPLILHWNGAAWSMRPSPSPGAASRLLAVVATSTANAWAVGYQQQTSGSPAQTLMEHWNGASWKVLSSPNPRSGLNRVYAVDADSANDAWAVGTYSNGSSLRPLAFHRG